MFSITWICFDFPVFFLKYKKYGMNYLFIKIQSKINSTGRQMWIIVTFVLKFCDSPLMIFYLQFLHRVLMRCVWNMSIYFLLHYAVRRYTAISTQSKWNLMCNIVSLILICWSLLSNCICVACEKFILKLVLKYEVSNNSLVSCWIDHINIKEI